MPTKAVERAGAGRPLCIEPQSLFFPVSSVVDSFGTASTTASDSRPWAIAVPEPEQQISAVFVAVP